MERLVIGLTGGIGAGKSTVARVMAGLGAQVVDVDALGREVLNPEGGAYHGVVARFGQTILEDDGTINRDRLAQQVFAGDDRLQELEAISHPAINAALSAQLDQTSRSLVVLDMAVLTESRLGWEGGVRIYHRVVVVEAPMPARLERLKGQGMSEAQIEGRLAAQASDRERRRLADLVVTNDATVADLEALLEQLWPTIEAWQTQ